MRPYSDPPKHNGQETSEHDPSANFPPKRSSHRKRRDLNPQSAATTTAARLAGEGNDDASVGVSVVSLGLVVRGLEEGIAAAAGGAVASRARAAGGEVEGGLRGGLVGCGRSEGQVCVELGVSVLHTRGRIPHFGLRCTPRDSREIRVMSAVLLPSLLRVNSTEGQPTPSLVQLLGADKVEATCNGVSTNASHAIATSGTILTWDHQMQ